LSSYIPHDYTIANPFFVLSIDDIQNNLSSGIEDVGTSQKLNFADLAAFLEKGSPKKITAKKSAGSPGNKHSKPMLPIKIAV